MALNSWLKSKLKKLRVFKFFIIPSRFLFILIARESGMSLSISLLARGFRSNGIQRARIDIIDANGENSINNIDVNADLDIHDM